MRFRKSQRNSFLALLYIRAWSYWVTRHWVWLSCFQLITTRAAAASAIRHQATNLDRSIQRSQLPIDACCGCGNGKFLDRLITRWLGWQLHTGPGNRCGVKPGHCKYSEMCSGNTMHVILCNHTPSGLRRALKLLLLLLLNLGNQQ